ncbi:MAG: uracil-DNA glycosylase [bacterium]
MGLIKQLENALRAKYSQSGWLFLEPINGALLETIQTELNQQGMETAPQKQKPRLQDLVDATHPVGDIRVLPENIHPPMSVPEIGTDSDKEPLNLDPTLAKTLDSLRLRLRDCNRCDLCNDRQKIVFGQGNIQAHVVFIGEGPGGDEDKSGIAFVGKAGKLLTQIIHSIGINRESVYICNVVKCRPPGNRNPKPEEISTCSPFLFKQLEILKPGLIVTLGNIATKTLLPDASGIMKMRGKLTAFHGIPLIPTFHPSYLLRNPSALNLVWNDMRQIRQVLFQQQAETDEGML